MRIETRIARRRRLLNQRLRPRCESLEHRRLLTSVPYTWQNAAIGAGGYVDGIFFSPNQQNTLYARTDIGGAYKSTNDGTTWQQLLDFVPGSTSQMMGVLSLAIDPQNTNNIYLDTGEYSGSDGWVLSSTNGGTSFSTTNLPFYVGGNSDGRGDGERLAVDPNLGSILFLGSNDHGLYQSSNSAGSFTANSAFNTLVGSSSEVTFVTFDKRSGTSGSASQIIYVGVDSTNAGTNIYKTTNGGTSWTELASGPTGLVPEKGSLDSDGNMYFTFGNALPPNGSITTGAVWRFNTATSAWASISPVVPGASSGDNFGYVGLAIDPEQAGTVVVTSFDRYSYIDTLWRTTNATAATPTWVALYNHSSSQNSGYGGYNTTRNTSSAPWTAGDGDGIGNWASAVAINPFNSAQLMYGTGQGIWATNNATSTTSLTAANSWYFPDTGIEFTAVGALAAPASGIPLYSAMGDIGGFSHTTLSTSPAAGNNNGGSDNDIDFAQSTPSYAAIIGNFTNGGAYSTNSGLTWTNFAATEPGSSGTVAVAANASALVWAPSGLGPYYSTNNGTTWTASTMPASAPSGSTLTGGKVISDRVNSSYFYYYTENSSDNQFNLYVSSNGGVTFTLASQTSTGNCSLTANPFTAGDLWLASYNPLYESTNFGTSFTYKVNNNPVTSASFIALGKAAPGQTYPAIYIWGTISGVTGVFRSDNKGANFVQINDSAHQWGGLIQTMAADPSTFGRLYMGFNGRGIIMGNPTGTLPTGWTDTDIKTPGNPGYATNATTLSTGTTVNQWTIDGGGTGLNGTSDQFNFTAESVTGNYAAEAQLTSLSNNGTGTPQAGVMFRAATGATDVFAALMQNTAGQLAFDYRTTTGGSLATVTLSSVPIAGEYLDLVRNGTKFSAYYGTDGIHWTQLGTTVTIAAMPTAANAGLAVASNYNPQLSSAIFGSVQIAAGPTISTGAYVVSSTSTTANLAVLGSDVSGESTLTYSWATTTSPAGSTAPTFSSNGSNGAKATTVHVYAAGSYQFTVTATDALNQTITSVVNLTVAAIATGVTVSPTSPSLIVGATQQFTASAVDQFGNTVTGFVYTATGGSINALSGMFTAGSTGGNFTVTATAGTVPGSTSIMVVPTVYTNLSGNYAFAIDLSPTVSGQLQIFINTPETGQPTYSIPLSQVPSLSFTGGTGNDSLTVDFTNGSPVPSNSSVAFNGSSGSGTLAIIGEPGNNTASVNAQQAVFDNANISYVNTASITITTGSGNDTLTQTAQPAAALTFNGGTGTDTLNVNAGTYVFASNPASTTANLTVNDNAAVSFTAGSSGGGVVAMQLANLTLGANASAVAALSPTSLDRTVLITTTLSIDPTAQLDLQNNDLIVSGGSFTAIDKLAGSGFALGQWNGQGLASSAAGTDSTHLASLGVFTNGTLGTPIYPTFDHQTLAGGEILIRYTTTGDANLDGRVDGSDYTKIDAGFNSSASGWSNGDFNYDGIVDGSDYTLIDNAFNTETLTAVPTAQIATATIESSTSSNQTLIATTAINSDDTRHRRRPQINNDGRNISVLEK